MSTVNGDNLDAILKDPLAADFSDIDKLMSQGQQEGAQDEKDPGASSDAGATEPESTQDAATTTTTGEPEEPAGAVIKTKDGKHEIPYEVLAREREARKRAEAQLAELSAKVANAEAASEGKQPDLTRSVDEIISADELAALKEDAPVLAATFEKLIGKIDSLEGEAQKGRQREEEQVKNAVQAAIDAVPKLAYVQASDDKTFEAISAIDNWARQQPQFQSMSLEARFDKVVAMYEAAHGPIQLPASASGSKEPSTDVKAKADAAIAKAMQNAAPNTLTDIPGGNPPAANEVEAVAGMSSLALTERFMKMTPTEMEAYLGKFA